ncbi:hypothetical protein EDB83DRAFT_2608550 [Lactarius deliciosus]|nr:hypothetical protein EDB83DRAFT_2608550 [Lactarius deliciosus]
MRIKREDDMDGRSWKQLDLDDNNEVGYRLESKVTKKSEEVEGEFKGGGVPLQEVGGKRITEVFLQVPVVGPDFQDRHTELKGKVWLIELFKAQPECWPYNMVVSWRVLGWGGGELAGGGVLRAVSGWRGGQWWLGLACRIETVWQVLVCRVGSVRWAGSGSVSGQDGGGSCARMACNVQGLVQRVGAARWVGCGRVSGQDGGGLHAQMACNVQGLVRRVGAVRWVGGGGMSGQDGGGLCARMACNMQGFACCVGVAQWVGGGSVLQAMSGRRVGAGTNGSGSHARPQGQQWPATLKASSSSATSSILHGCGDGLRGITVW